MEITNDFELPEPLVNFAKSDYVYKPNNYSVTELLKGTAEIVLLRRHSSEIKKDIASLAWSVFGTAVHLLLEKQPVSAGITKEQHISMEFGNITVNGRYDLLNENIETVDDYKTASVTKIIKQEFDDYYKQGGMYCLMLTKKGIPCHTARFVMFLKDFSKSKQRLDYRYPKMPIYVKIFHYTDDDLDKIEKHIIDKLAEIKEMEKLPDEQLCPCSEEERWSEPTTYALKQKGRKTAIKIFKDRETAQKAIKNSNMYIEERKGVSHKCADYCDVCEFCPYGKMLLNNGAGKLPF